MFMEPFYGENYMEGQYYWRMNRRDEFECRICTDKAEGYHFGALSCAACGAFFRRSVSDQKVYSCATKRCEIVFEPNRRGGSCRYCRFSKCLTSGMIPQEVKAKRTSSASNFSLMLQTLSDHSTALIENVIQFRQQLQIEKEQLPQLPLDNRNMINIMNSLQSEFELLKRISPNCVFLNELIPVAGLGFSDFTELAETDPLRDIVIMMFVFESCITTSSNGGIQLDRLIFPNMIFVELNESPQQSTFQRCMNYLVQTAAKAIQSAHLDESYLAILYYSVVTRHAPLESQFQRYHFNRSQLLENMRTVTHCPRAVDFQTLEHILLDGARLFKEAIRYDYL